MQVNSPSGVNYCKGYYAARSARRLIRLVHFVLVGPVVARQDAVGLHSLAVEPPYLCNGLLVILTFE